MAKTKILAVDDELSITEVLKAYLKREGYEVITSQTGQGALSLAQNETPDLIILDLMLPGMSGEEVLKQLRRDGSRVPVIMLTAKTALEDKLYGLSIGADDYIVKPFSSQEVVARVKTILRRSEPENVPLTDLLTLAGGRLEINTLAHSVTWQQQHIDLTPTEFNLLLYLASHPGHVYTRNQLAESLFGYNSFTEERTIDAHIKNLRNKMQGKGAPNLIKTIYGVGYKYEEA